MNDSKSNDVKSPSSWSFFDQDIIGEYDVSTYVNWKEILSLIDVHYKVNSFLLINNVCDDVNFILPKFMHLCMIRFVDNTSMEGAMELQDDGQGEEKELQGKDVSIRTARSPEFETDMDSSYGLQMRQMSTIRIGNFKSFPMDPAPSPQDRSLRPEDPGVSGLTPDDPERNS